MSDKPNRTSDEVNILARNLSHQWSGSKTSIRFPDFEVRSGEHWYFRGASGSGKSTLLGLLAGLAVPSRGTLDVLGQEMSQTSRRRRDRLRANDLGVIFQQFNLVPYLSAVGNVQLPCRLSKDRARRCAQGQPDREAKQLLLALDIDESLWDRPVNALSVGQQQRVAAARALIGAPALILADEPTSALDSDNRDRFMDLLLTQCQKVGASLIFVSHDRALAHLFPNTLELGPHQ